MATITIRNLSPEIVENLKALASRNGRSMEQEAREILAYRLASRSSILDAIQAKWEEYAPPSAQEIQDWITAGRRGRE
jgi:plasmid stability protein